MALSEGGSLMDGSADLRNSKPEFVVFNLRFLMSLTKARVGVCGRRNPAEMRVMLDTPGSPLPDCALIFILRDGAAGSLGRV